jgi:hypothetical protein
MVPNDRLSQNAPPPPEQRALTILPHPNLTIPILDDEDVKTLLGRFTRSDCERLWSDAQYNDKHLELLALMQRFELCYELRDSDPATWLTPQLLPPAKPTALESWGQPQDSVLRYRYQFLPKGVLSRLTVRMHRFVQDPKLAWATGAVFERDGSQVLVELLPDARRSNSAPAVLSAKPFSASSPPTSTPSMTRSRA